MRRHQAVAGISLVELGTGRLLEEVHRRHVRRVAGQMAQVAAAARRRPAAIAELAPAALA
jgi:hypothetical protein